MGISDMIAGFIDGLLEEEDTVELQRAELAGRFNCVPSQINYVITTRFSPERGYVVESRRGGGGYIRIRRVQADPKLLLMHTVNAIGGTIDAHSAAALLENCLNAGVLDASAVRLMLAAVSSRAIGAAPPEARDALRASILKQMLINAL